MIIYPYTLYCWIFSRLAPCIFYVLQIVHKAAAPICQDMMARKASLQNCLRCSVKSETSPFLTRKRVSRLPHSAQRFWARGIGSQPLTEPGRNATLPRATVQGVNSAPEFVAVGAMATAFLPGSVKGGGWKFQPTNNWGNQRQDKAHNPKGILLPKHRQYDRPHIPRMLRFGSSAA